MGECYWSRLNMIGPHGPGKDKMNNSIFDIALQNIKRKEWARETAKKMLPQLLCGRRHCKECIYQGYCIREA